LAGVLCRVSFDSHGGVPMKTFLRILTAGLVLTTFHSVGALAQKDSGQVVREKTSVTVIEVPVNVIGKDGRPISNLTATDFELYDEGKLQSITGFDRIDLNRNAAAEGAEELPAAARRLWLLVFDRPYRASTVRRRARDGATAFVTNTMKPDDLAAVGTLSADTGWRLLVNFTHDRQQLARAIETLGMPGLAVP